MGKFRKSDLDSEQTPGFSCVKFQWNKTPSVDTQCTVQFKLFMIVSRRNLNCEMIFNCIRII